MPSRLPSSFEENAEFYEESRSQKILRRLKEEPLIPLGCGLTCLALWRATRSMRAGDHHQTNRMFRARIYAQAFTLLVIYVGGQYYAEERKKRKEVDGVISEKKAAEKREAWIRELEARDKEDKEDQERRRRIKQERLGVNETDAKWEGVAKMILEPNERRGGILDAVKSLPWK